MPTHIGGTTAEVLGVEASAWNQACFSDDHEIFRPTNHFDVIRTLAHRLDPNISFARIEEAARQRQARFDYALTTHVSQDVIDTLRKLRDQGYQIALISNPSTLRCRPGPTHPCDSCSIFRYSVVMWA